MKYLVVPDFKPQLIVYQNPLKVKMKKILVTGGAGFIGTQICKELCGQGHSVICLDNLYTGSKKNIFALKQLPNFSFLEHDICIPIDLTVDEIYNFACPASPPHYQADPIRTMKTSVLGAMNMLELARKTGAKILQASTSEIYGDPQIHPQPETYWGNVNTIGVRACYDEGKRVVETLIYDYQRHHNVNVRVARIFNTYGPGMHPRDGRVVSNFIVQALKNAPITLYGIGHQTRSFCYRDDLVDGLIRLMNAPDTVSFPINIGNPKEFTIRQLAHMIIDLTGTKSVLTFRSFPEDDPLQRCPDIGRAKKHLNWRPQVELREGLLKTIDYFATVLNCAKASDNKLCSQESVQ